MLRGTIKNNTMPRPPSVPNQDMQFFFFFVNFCGVDHFRFGLTYGLFFIREPFGIVFLFEATDKLTTLYFEDPYAVW